MKLNPPAFFFAAIGLMVVLHLLVPLLVFSFYLFLVIGALAMLAGLYCTVTGAQLFDHHGTTITPFETSQKLVTEGLFRLSRNPMYLGMLVCLFGLALLLGSLSAFIPVVLFYWVVSRWFVAREEQMLEETFGESYQDYKRHTRRWL